MIGRFAQRCIVLPLGLVLCVAGVALWGLDAALTNLRRHVHGGTP